MPETKERCIIRIIQPPRTRKIFAEDQTIEYNFRFKAFFFFLFSQKTPWPLIFVYTPTNMFHISQERLMWWFNFLFRVKIGASRIFIMMRVPKTEQSINRPIVTRTVTVGMEMDTTVVWDSLNNNKTVIASNQ